MMRKLLFLIIFSMPLASFAQSADEQIAGCLNSSDFFLLEEIYPKLKDEVQTPMLKAFSEALLNGIFNHPQQAVASIDLLVNNFQGEIGFDNVKNMLAWQNNILFRMGEYCEAASRSNRFLEQLAPHLDSVTVSQLRYTCKYYDSMCGQKKSELVRPDEDCVIPIYMEPFEKEGFKKGHMLYVPARINGTDEKFIFDTGCPGGAILSEDYAEKYNVKVTLDSMIVSGVGGVSWGKMGILDSINVGNMTFKNLTVIVVPPNVATDTVIKFNALLGYDIIKLAGEVQIMPKEKKIIFPVNKTPVPATGRNLKIDGSELFSIKVYSGDEQLIMNLDTGDSDGSLLYKYYEKHRESITQNGRKETLKYGGFGGIATSDYYYLPEFPLRVGDKSFTMKEIPVNSKSVDVISDIDGSFGIGMINLFDKVTINFDQMFVTVE